MDLSRIESYKDIYGYRKVFDICLATPFEPEETDGSRYGFYEKTSEKIGKLGKKIFVPHKEIDLNWPPAKIYDIIQEIIIPHSELVLCEISASLAAGMMGGRAYQCKKPVIHFYRKGAFLENIIFRLDVFDLIEYTQEKEALEKIKLSVEKFYKNP